MDPLSVSAGIAGLLIATAQISSILRDYSRSARGASKQARTIFLEITDISVALHSLQSFLVGTTAVRKSRASLILVEQLIVALTGCVTTISDLEAMITGLKVDGSMHLLDRVKWARKEASINEVVHRLQNHKSSLTLMLTILECKSTMQAERSTDRLCGLVEQALVSNLEIHNRLRAMKTFCGCECSAPFSTESRNSDNRVSIASWSSFHDRQNEMFPQAPLSQSGFEEELDISRVYKRARNCSQSSLVSLANQPTASVILSRFSLGEISVVAVLDLPLCSADVFNDHLYKFGDSPKYAMVYKNEDDGCTGNKLGTTRTPCSRQSSIRACEPLRSSLWKLPPIGLLSKPALKPIRGVFGVPLHKCIKYASLAISLTDKRGSLTVKGHIPVVVGRLCSFLKSKEAFNVPSAFDRSGDAQKMDLLQRAFEEPPGYGRELDLTGYSLFDAAGVLLRYLNSLPEPLIPTSSYEQACHKSSYFVETWNANTDSAAASVASLRVLTKNISLPQYHLLLYILEFLAGFESTLGINDMSATTLANVFQPCILRDAARDEGTTDKRSARNVVKALIQDQETFNDTGIVQIAFNGAGIV